jgi:hypothetical protein
MSMTRNSANSSQKPGEPFKSPRCLQCGGPKSLEDLYRPICDSCRREEFPKGSLGHAWRWGLLGWFQDHARTTTEEQALAAEELRSIFRQYEGLYEICMLAYQNLDYCKHAGFPEAEFSVEIWERLIQWLIISRHTDGKGIPWMRNAALMMPRSEVLAHLKRAFDHDPAPNVAAQEAQALDIPTGAEQSTPPPKPQSLAPQSNPIPPDRQTRPMKLNEAAKHFGFGGKKAREKLRRMGLLIHQLGPQCFVFDKNQFPSSVLPQIEPKAQNDPN